MTAGRMALVIQKEIVWLLNDKLKLVSKKFHDRWLGFYEVVARLSKLFYDIRDPTNAKVERVQFNLLK